MIFCGVRQASLPPPAISSSERKTSAILQNGTRDLENCQKCMEGEPPSSSKKTINFWGSRQAHLSSPAISFSGRKTFAIFQNGGTRNEANCQKIYGWDNARALEKNDKNSHAPLSLNKKRTIGPRLWHTPQRHIKIKKSRRLILLPVRYSSLRRMREWKDLEG